MSVRPPSRTPALLRRARSRSDAGLAGLRTQAPASGFARCVAVGLCWLLGALLVVLPGCEKPLAVEAEDAADGGPCGRGKARSCECASGQRGIAQCVAGSDWSECVCGESSFDVADEPEPDAGRDAGSIRDLKPGDDTLGIPKSTLDCESRFDMRAHATTGKADPYLIHGGPGLVGASEVAVCFYFRAEYAPNTRAIALQPLLDEVSRPHHWLLYGLDDSGQHRDGEVGACKAIEPGAYLLGGFYPGSRDVLLPSDVGLALPSGAAAGFVLEVHYLDPGALELIDRTGVRVCTAPALAPNSRLKNTAAVHMLGTEGICIPPVRQAYEVAGTCTPHADQGNIHILSVWPHMHRLGRRMTVTIKRKNGTSELLHDEPYNVSSTVLHETGDVIIGPGDKLETRCTYDNDQLFSVPFGEKVSDEMCFAFVTAWPAGALSIDPATLDPLRALSVGPQASRRCLDPYGILASCSGVADSPY